MEKTSCLLYFVKNCFVSTFFVKGKKEQLFVCKFIKHDILVKLKKFPFNLTSGSYTMTDLCSLFYILTVFVLLIYYWSLPFLFPNKIVFLLCNNKILDLVLSSFILYVLFWGARRRRIRRCAGARTRIRRTKWCLLGKLFTATVNSLPNKHS